MDLNDTMALEVSLDRDTEDESDHNRERRVVASLIVKTIPEGNPNLTFPIHAGLNKIGRGLECDIRIQSESMSKQHCCIECTNSVHLIYDLKSCNKTKRNGVPLIPEVRYELRHEDNLTLGSLCCEYRFATADKQVDEAELTTVNEAELATVGEAELAAVDEAEPATVGEAELAAIDEREDADSRKCTSKDDDDVGESDSDSTRSQDLLMNVDNEAAAMSICDSYHDDDDDEDEDRGGGGGGGEKKDEEVLEKPVDSTSEVQNDTINKNSTVSGKPQDIPKFNIFADFLEADAVDDKKEMNDTKASIVSEVQTPPNKRNCISDVNVVYETPSIDANICPRSDVLDSSVSRENSLTEPNFAAETQDPMDGASSYGPRRMCIAASLIRPTDVTEVPDTPEKDQFDCHTSVVACASNFRSIESPENFSDSSGEEGLRESDVQLRRKLFHDSVDVKVGLQEDKVVELRDSQPPAASINEKQEVNPNNCDAVAAVEKCDSGGDVTTGEGCRTLVQSGEDGVIQEAEVESSVQEVCHDAQGEEVGVNSNQSAVGKDHHEEKLDSNAEPSKDFSLKEDALTENCTGLPPDRECEANIEEDAADEVFPASNVFDAHKSFNRSTTEVETSPGKVFPMSYAQRRQSSTGSALKHKRKQHVNVHSPLKNRIVKDDKESKEQEDKIEIRTTSNLKTRMSSSKNVGNSNFKKLFETKSNEYELDCPADPDGGSELRMRRRRRSDANSGKEEAKVIQKTVADNLSSIAFKKKFGGNKNVLKNSSFKTRNRKSSKGEAELKSDKSDSLGDGEFSKKEAGVLASKRVSMRSNKGKFLGNPDFIKYSSQDQIGETSNVAKKDEKVTRSRRKIVTVVSCVDDPNKKKPGLSDAEKLGENSLSPAENVSSRSKEIQDSNVHELHNELSSAAQPSEEITDDRSLKTELKESARDVGRIASSAKKKKKQTMNEKDSRVVSTPVLENEGENDDEGRLAVSCKRKDSNSDDLKQRRGLEEVDIEGGPPACDANDVKQSFKEPSTSTVKRVHSRSRHHKELPDAKVEEDKLVKQTGKKDPSSLSEELDGGSKVEAVGEVDVSAMRSDKQAKTQKMLKRTRSTAALARDEDELPPRKSPKDDETSGSADDNHLPSKSKDNGKQAASGEDRKSKVEITPSGLSSTEKKRKHSDDDGGTSSKYKKRKTRECQSARKSEALASNLDGDDKEEVAEGDLVELRCSRRSQVCLPESDVSSVTRDDLVKPKVLFTGVRSDDALKIIKKFGGEEASSVHDCTHIISDQVRRTIKFMCGVARGIPIVTHEWLKECKKRKKVVDAWDYLVEDKESESKYGFSLRESLRRSSSKKLFEGMSFHVTKNVKPVPSEMSEIITCAGGKIVGQLPKKNSKNIIIITCPEDLKSNERFASSDVPVVSSEFVMTGVLRQVKDVQEFPLSQQPVEGKSDKNSSERSRASSRFRKH